MEHFSKYFEVTGNCLNSSTGYYELNSLYDYLTFSIALSDNDISNFEIVEYAFIYLRHRTYDSDIHNVQLYLLEDNQEKLVDYAIKRENIDYEKLVFDVTPLFFGNKRRSCSFKIKYNGTNLFEIESGSNKHRLYLEYVKEESLPATHPSLSKSVSDRLSYSVNLISGSYSFIKSLPNDVLKYDLSLVYDCMSEDSFAFLPKRWKLSILEKIIITRNSNNEITSIEYIDSSYKRHYFETDEDSSPFFYDKKGTGLIIEVVLDGYKLFDGVSAHGYKKFDSDGYIIEIKDAYNRLISFDYHLLSFVPNGNSGAQINGVDSDAQLFDPPGPIEPIVLYKYIDITDYNGHILRIKKSISSSTKAYIEIYENQTALNNSTALYSYELNISSGYLSSIKEGSNELTNIYYNNLHQITTLQESTGYECNIAYACEKPKTIIHKYSTDVVDKYSIDYQVEKTIINDYHDIKTAYVYFDLYAKGVMVSEELVSNFGYVSFASKRFVSFPSNCRIYDLQNTLLNNQFDVTNNGNGLTIQSGKKYIAIIRLIKAGEQDNNPVIPTVNKTDLKLTIQYSSNVTEEINLASFSREKDFIFTYQSNSTFDPIFTVSTGNYPNLIALHIYLFEYKEEYKDGCFLTKNGIDYHFEDDNHELLLGDEHCYKKDVAINKIFKACSSPLRWTHNKSKLLNNADLNSYVYKENAVTLFDSLNIITTVFKEKIIIKTVDDGVVRYPIYSLSYLQCSSSGYYIFNTDTVIDQETYHSYKKYDSLFRLFEEQNEDGIKVFYEYDDDKVIAQTTSNADGSLNSKAELSYDTKDRLVEQIDDRYFVNSVTSTTYQNSYLSPSCITKNTTNVISYQYDNLHLKPVELSTDSVSSITYTYSNDNLTEFNNDTYFRYSYGDYGLFNDFSIKIGNSYHSLVSITYFLDEDGNDITVNYDNGFERRTYFNKYGNINYIAHGNQVAAKYLYFDKKPNSLDTLTSCDDPSIYSKLYKIIDNCISRDTYFDYNNHGGLSSFENKESNTSIFSETLTYDLFSRLESKSIETAYNSFEITYSYENNSKSTPYEIITVFDVLNEQIQVSEEVQYDSLKQISTISTTFYSTFNFYSEYFYPEQVVSSKNYSSLFPTRIDYYYKEEGSHHETYLYSSHISYDANGQITAINEGDQNYGVSFTGQQFSYDNKGQLVSEINYDLGYRYSYNYDNNGNITSVIRYDLSDNVISTDTYSYHSSYKDLLVSFNNQTITYDANYNPLTIGSDALSWERGRLLNSLTIDNVQTSFSYDYLGFRTSKTTENKTHKYLYDDNHRLIEEEIYNNNTLEYAITYIYGLTGIIGFKIEDVLFRFEKNILNDVVAIYEEDEQIAKYVYDAYGNHIVLDSNDEEEDDPDFIGNINPIRYRSYYYDRETDLYYCQSRYYNPTFRRWLNMDMVSYQDTGDIIGVNLFCYCKNNPIMYSDETGHDIAAIIIGLIIGAIIGTGVGFGIALNIDYQNDQEFFNGDVQWYDYLGASVLGSLIGGAVGAGAGYVSGLSWPGVMPVINISKNGISVVAHSITITGCDVLSISSLLGVTIMASTIGKSNGYRVDIYPNDHEPAHVHIRGDDIKSPKGIRVGIDGNSLPGEPPLPSGAKKALKNLWEKIMRAFARWGM